MKTRSLTALGAVAAAMLLLSACAAPAPDSGPVDSGEPQYGGTLSLSISQEPPHLNRNILSQPALSMTSPLWAEQLIDQAVDGGLEPRLAESWDVSEDGLVYTFNLRQDVSWHDGEQFDAEDVLWTLESSMPLNPRTNTAWQLVTDVTAPDEYTVVMTLSQPYSPLLALLSGSLVTMLPSHLYEGDDIADSPVNSSPVGTGPFKFVKWDKGQQIVFEKNDDYWKDELPYFDGVSVKVITTEVTSANAIKSGEIHFLSGSELSPQVKQDLEAQNNLVSREVTSNPSQYVMGFNTTGGIMADVEVRRAIVQAIDREQILSTVFGGEGWVAETVIPESFPELRDTENTFEKAYPLDPDAAAEALDEAGYPLDGDTRFDIDILVPMGDVYLSPANIIKAQLAEIGVNANVIQLDEQSHADRVYINHEYDLYISSYLSDVDPAIGTERLYSCATIDKIYGNGTGYCNDIVQAAWDDGRALTDPAERQEAYSVATKQIIEDMPRLPLVNYRSTGFLSKTLGNTEEEFRLGDGSNPDWADSWFIG